MMAVGSRQRFSKRHPCPVCHGFKEMPQGEGIRCWGYLSDDGQWAYCTRPEYAGLLEVKPGSDTYAHKLHGNCRCGTSHSREVSEPKASANGRRIITATYDYLNEQSNLIY